MGEHTFHFEGTWDGGYKGEGQITVGNLSTVISRVKSMDGLGEGTNPDEMLIGAAGSCFLMSLTYIWWDTGTGSLSQSISTVSF
jgi:peroxiredoxin-like protein